MVFIFGEKSAIRTVEVRSKKMVAACPVDNQKPPSKK